MMNFCHPVMKPTALCSTVCTDGYEVTNLISKDANLQRKGFITYHAIRPPVTVELNFMCKVNVSEVILWSEVGSQKSTGFELYAASTCNSGAPCTCKNLCSSSYEKVAFGFINGSEKGLVFSRNNNVSSHVDNRAFVKYMFFSSKRTVLNQVNSLQIKIVKTSSCPCLARVEVWGQPSSSSNDATRKAVVSLWKERNAEVARVKTSTKIHRNDKAISLDDIDNGAVKIPEEFLDPITFKLMALPMTLPCGKIVDQSTLDRFEQYEATWGRPPSDPFTGKAFTESSHAILATSLKARIDRFLIEHSSLPEVKTAARTVGGKPPTATVTSSYFNTSTVGSVKMEKNEPKRACNVLPAECSASKKQRVAQCLTLNHEERVNRSLRSAVKNVLAGLPSFTKFEDTREVKPAGCMNCSSNEMLYKLPCQHYICRTCLVCKQTSMQMKCDKCNTGFQSDEPQRHYS